MIKGDGKIIPWMRSYSRDTKYIYEKIKNVDLEGLTLFFYINLIEVN